MDGGHGVGTPYGTVSVLASLTVGTQPLSPYIRGKLTLAGIDPRDPVGSVADCVYAIVADAPHDVLQQWDKKLIMEGAKAWPERDTWGVLPEHRRLSGGLMSSSDEAPTISRVKRGDGREG